jgi:hypothetical protein
MPTNVVFTPDTRSVGRRGDVAEAAHEGVQESALSGAFFCAGGGGRVGVVVWFFWWACIACIAGIAGGGKFLAE